MVIPISFMNLCKVKTLDKQGVHRDGMIADFNNKEQ